MTEFNFGTFTKPEKVNPYTEIVEQLAKAAEDNPAASVSFPVDVNKAATERIKFGQAANKIDKTAKLVNQDKSGVSVAGQDEDGNDVLTGDVILTFTLGKRQKPRRGQVVNKETEAPAKATK